MNFAQLMSVIIARKWVFFGVFLLTVIATAITSFLIPKTYTASTSLVINFKGADPVTGTVMPGTLMPSYMATQVDIIESRNVALKVVDKLGIVNNPIAKERFEKEAKGNGDIRDWFASELLGNLKVHPSRESNVIDISYQGSDPKFAAALANTFAWAYMSTNLQLKTDPAKQVASWFEDQAKGFRQNVEAAQAKLSAYQEKHGIASSEDNMDVEMARLRELSSQLVAAQAQTYDSTSRKNQLRHGAASESPEILSNSLIQSLKSQLAQAEARLYDVSKSLGVSHPKYQSSQQEVNNLRELIRAETAKTSNSLGQTARVSQQKEAEIKAALAAQKARVLSLKSQRDEMAVLVREAENAQRIYDNALLRFGQTNMEGQSVQTDISILNPAISPIKHSSPRITLNILLSIFLGALLGLLSVVAIELKNRKVRTVDDLKKFIDVPVLAEIYKAAKGFKRNPSAT